MADRPPLPYRPFMPDFGSGGAGRPSPAPSAPVTAAPPAAVAAAGKTAVKDLLVPAILLAKETRVGAGTIIPCPDVNTLSPQLLFKNDQKTPAIVHARAIITSGGPQPWVLFGGTPNAVAEFATAEVVLADGERETFTVLPGDSLWTACTDSALGNGGSVGIVVADLGRTLDALRQLVDSRVFG